MKARLAVGLLAWVALWPLVHRAAVAAFDLNPWKLGGFAMYTTATPPVQVVALRAQGGALVPLDESRLPPEAQAALRRFRIERHALGDLRSADDLGAALLDARSDLPHVVIAVQRMQLDPASARMTSQRDTYVFERDP